MKDNTGSVKHPVHNALLNVPFMTICLISTLKAFFKKKRYVGFKTSEPQFATSFTHDSHVEMSKITAAIRSMDAGFLSRCFKNPGCGTIMPRGENAPMINISSVV